MERLDVGIWLWVRCAWGGGTNPPPPPPGQIFVEAYSTAPTCYVRPLKEERERDRERERERERGIEGKRERGGEGERKRGRGCLMMVWHRNSL